MAGMVMVAVFFWSAVALALLLPHAVVAAGGAPLAASYKFLGWIGIYFVTTLAYSLVLKRKMLIDVIVLSGLYTVRIMAGSAATGVGVSTWLLDFSIFFFLLLAFVKRFSELESLRSREGTVSNGRGYVMADLEQLRAFGTGIGCASAVVLTLYINDLSATHLYRYPARLWLAVSVLLLWLFRVWMLASRGEMDEDPVVYAITDKRSLLLGAIVAGIVLLAL
jgi:4-hydroxybenzoate polyprenyltransferase